MASNHTMKFISGLIFGGLAGAAAAMLYAPQAGDETRRMIRNTAMDAQVKARDTIGQVQDQVSSKVEDVQQRVGAKMEDVQQRVGQMTDEVRSKASRLKDVGQDVAQQQKQALRTGMSEGEDILND